MTANDAIRSFWDWWATARTRVENAIEVERNFSEALVKEISDHVDAIGDLDWELAPGRKAKHAFCMSPKGDPNMRLVSETWKHLGPGADETWEYFPSRQPQEGTQLEIADVKLVRDDIWVAFEVDKSHERIHASYWHPSFAQLPEQVQLTALFLLLDGALGEDGVERWLGRIELAPEKPDAAKPFADFMTAVGELSSTATGESFAVMRGTTADGQPIYVSCNQAIKRIDHVLDIMHIAISLDIVDLPTNEDAKQLNELEDQLSSQLGGRAIYFGRETIPGKRTIHFYAPEDSGAASIIERWAKQHADRNPQVEWIRDPTWEFVKRYV
ncbi:MAG: DUF695 domain-containing protein [Kofleriaceae bacterium]